MKEFTKQRTVEENWAASAWGEEVADCVLVATPSTSHSINHESQIKELIPEAPGDLKAYVRSEILAQRPAGEDEWRGENGHLYRFSVRDGDLGIKRIAPTVGHWAPEKYFAGPLPAVARAWRERALAENEFIDPEGKRHELRWRNGSPEWFADGGWCRWGVFGSTGYEAGDAWFRKYCPADRFVTDDGRVLEFRMNDDGRAEAFDQRQTIPCWGTDWHGPRKEYSDALYRFRDAERAKWTFETEGNLISYENESEGYIGTFNGKSHSGSFCQLAPTWVRSRAEKMWRERESKWRTFWHPERSVVTVEKWLTDKWVNWGTFGRTGWVECDIIPEEYRAEARAKFRENYTLKRNEIWQRGKVAKVYFDGRVRNSGSDAVLFQDNDEGQREHWRLGWFADNAERLEAFDRMRAFYYEEHPGKALCQDGRPVVFELHAIDGFSEGDIGWARYVDPGYGPTMALRSSRNVGERWRALQDKLRAWTAEQLKARNATNPQIGTTSGTYHPELSFNLEGSFDGKTVRLSLPGYAEETLVTFRGGMPEWLQHGPLTLTISPAKVAGTE